MVTIFKGLNTVDQIRAPYTLTDVDLIKRDLLNEFYTKKGERVMRPNFGSIIWDLVMNPQDEFTEQEVREDIERIIAKHSRVELVDITVFSSDKSIRADITLNYVILDSTDVLYLEFINDDI